MSYESTHAVIRLIVPNTPWSTNTCIMPKHSLALCATLTTISSLNSPTDCHRILEWYGYCGVCMCLHTHKLGKIWGHAPLGKFEKLGTLRLEVSLKPKCY